MTVSRGSLDEKARLERAAMLMFVRSLRSVYERNLQIVEQRERPDFVAIDQAARLVGVEVTHLYHNREEARYLNGRGNEEIHPITTPEELIDALNRSLQKKSDLSRGYEWFERMILLIRVPSPAVQSHAILERQPLVIVPPSAFDEIWLLFYDYDHLDWADLLQLR